MEYIFFTDLRSSKIVEAQKSFLKECRAKIAEAQKSFLRECRAKIAEATESLS
jgi:hypothetical protein